MGLFLVGSGCFALYALGYGIKGLLEKSEVETKEMEVYEENDRLIVEAKYTEL